MANNFDYISMLNMPELSPLAAADTEFQSDLDLWLNADFNFESLDAAAYRERKAVSGSFDFAAQPKVESAPPALNLSLLQHPAVAPAADALSFGSRVMMTLAPNFSAADMTSLDMFQAVPDMSLQHEQFVSPAALVESPAVTAMVEKPASSVVGEEREKTEEEVDKRRRNTQASARFRAKKKQREQALEKTAKEMSDRANALERRVKEVELELKWMRQLVTDREGKKRLRDFYNESGLAFGAETMAAGSGIESQPLTNFEEDHESKRQRIA
ncbi:hypothetical protein HKX48_008915 [Thoreauomyces humboldtii]|nr:hypothetical protein HKX48_008915 [Thoreauomyces humboldtii]